ncbi:MAG: XRE family transcriptional regulator [Candidatus Eremiobacteraeota bacterium]|nr:XRE family transcriptional regulator [Candidatus Eremiobacteraeota bacterium]MBV8459316.1 XRE family transcriptional regulator [Candidatus Eremiobacteraeota bacterium]
MVAASFGDALREFRIRACLSQEELAAKAGLSTIAIGALERGVRKAPHRDTVARLVKALDLTADESAALIAVRHAVHRKAAANQVAQNLPAARTSFIGRDSDLDTILTLLRRSRLVTLTGSGGVGKMRAAVEAAARAHESPWNEIWFIDFSPLSEGAFIPAAIATAVQLPLGGDVETIAAVASLLAKRRALLIFDNCEHVVSEAARAAYTILERCPQITILATSRERLNVAGEFVYRLPSLEPEAAGDLFIERAQAVAPRRTFTERDLLIVHDITRRLDGIPLLSSWLPLIRRRSVSTRYAPVSMRNSVFLWVVATCRRGNRACLRPSPGVTNS